jgi:hydrogenase nickel incorporation protein HypA/HybF
MHELSIAENIVEIAEQSAKQENCAVINEIEIEVGIMSGVVIEALEFAMDSMIKQTMLSKAKVKIIQIEGKARCNHCKKVFEIKDFADVCPHCNQYDFDIIQGKELRVKTIKAE